MATVRRFEDLAVWQLSVQLRDKVIRHTGSGPAARDLKFRDQIRESARSAPRNIAEGFDRYRPREFAHFVRIARGSLGETVNHLVDGRKQGYFKDDDAGMMMALARRAQGAATRLLTYLDSCDPSGPHPSRARKVTAPPER